MRTTKFLSIAALGVAGVFLAAPGANATEAHGTIGFDVNPARPGQAVTILGGCDAPGFTTAKVDSQGALEPVEVYLKDDGSGKKELWGTTAVATDAKPGTYSVSYRCGDVTVRAKFTVAGADKKPATTTKPAPAKPAPQVAVAPKGAANTGGDGVAVVADVSADQANAAPKSDGPGAGVYAIGGAGLLAAGGAGAFAFRRLRKQS
jgi:hypothetical protein